MAVGVHFPAHAQPATMVEQGEALPLSAQTRAVVGATPVDHGADLRRSGQTTVLPGVTAPSASTESGRR